MASTLDLIFSPKNDEECFGVVVTLGRGCFEDTGDGPTALEGIVADLECCWNLSLAERSGMNSAADEDSLLIVFTLIISFSLLSTKGFFAVGGFSVMTLGGSFVLSGFDSGWGCATFGWTTFGWTTFGNTSGEAVGSTAHTVTQNVSKWD
jgi:hypothetical protein